MERWTNIHVHQISDICLGEERIDERSAYEFLHTLIKNTLSASGEKWKKLGLIKQFTQLNHFDSKKVIEHLKEAAFSEIYRPLEIIVISNLKGGTKKILILRKSPLSNLLSEILQVNIVNYRLWYSHLFRILKRKDYIYDQLASDIYYSSQILTIFKMGTRWVLLLMTICMAFFCRRYKVKQGSSAKASVGIDYWQRRFRPDEMNEVFWIKESEIPLQNLYNLETREFDHKSHEEFAKIGMRRVRLLTRPWELIRFISDRRHQNNSANLYLITPNRSFIKRIPKLFGALLRCPVNSRERFWICIQLLSFKYSVQYWENIYEQLNIRLLSSIVDTDPGKLAKAQSMENRNGFFTGSHWSNFPMIRGDNQKCYDILLAWGDHFIDNILNPYPSMLKMPVGYPLDYCFKLHKSASNELRERYPGKFILLYVDNIVAQDLPYSRKMQFDMYQMFCDLFNEHENLIVFVKPKKAHTFNEAVNSLPELVRHMDSDKIIVFSPSSIEAKLGPSRIGMASDLVVGMGISSAAAECQFAGIPAFHADLTNFSDNEFANRGDGEIVFRNVDSLKTAISKYITEGQINGKIDFRPYYDMLDPFQDGQTYRRIGFIMKTVFDLVQQDKSRLEMAKIVKQRYERIVSDLASNDIT